MDLKLPEGLPDRLKKIKAAREAIEAWEKAGEKAMNAIVDLGHVGRRAVPWTSDELREQILTAIQGSESGLRFSELQQLFGATEQQVRWALKRLRADGKVETTGNQRHMWYRVPAKRRKRG